MLVVHVYHGQTIVGEIFKGQQVEIVEKRERIYIHVYIYICVCVCVMREGGGREGMDSRNEGKEFFFFFN